MAYVGAPTLETRGVWAPSFSAWAQGLQGPPKQVREARAVAREGPAADLVRGLALMGLGRDEVEALGALVEARRAQGPEDEDLLFGF